MRLRHARAATLVLFAAAVSACSQSSERATTGGPRETNSTSATSAGADAGEDAEDGEVLFAVGDIAACDSGGDEQTAALLDGTAGTIAALGDTVYELGTHEEYADCFEPSWGRHKARVRPAVGNHEYGTAGASGYFDYFGPAAGNRGEGWYGYDVGSWRVVVINSVCGPAGGCAAGSPQERWLRADLAATSTRCTLAYSHHPRFSSGLHGSDPSLSDIWTALYEGGVDVALAGHDHHYERFAPLDATGAVDEARGVRQFIVGTGGNVTYPVLRRLPGSEAVFTGGYGVLRLVLSDGRYQWDYLGVPGVSFTDTGEATCH